MANCGMSVVLTFAVEHLVGRTTHTVVEGRDAALLKPTGSKIMGISNQLARLRLAQR